MLIGRITGATRTLGQGQGFLGLPIRDSIRKDPSGFHIQMESAWHPTPDELERLNAGAPVILAILGTLHPPVSIIVGEPPDDTL